MFADRSSVALSSLLSALALSVAIELANGYYTPLAAKLLLLAFLLPCAALLAPKHATVERVCAAGLYPAMVFGLILQASMLTAFRPAMYLQALQLTDVWSWHGGVIAIAVCSLATQLQPRLRAGMMLAAFVCLGHWLIVHSPDPHVDVLLFWRESTQALLRGENAFALDFADIYGKGHYPAALVANGRVLHGFPYPPVHLLAGVVGAAFGDVRYALVLALAAAAAAFMALGGRSKGFLCAALLLLTPRCLFLLEQGFVEPIGIACLAATVWAERRGGRATPYALGLLLVSKQTMPFLACCAWLLLARRQGWAQKRSFVLRTLAAGCAVTLPFILVSPQAFWHSCVVVHWQQLKQSGCLTFGQHLVQTLHCQPFSIGACLALWLGCTALVLWRAPRTTSGFCLGLSLCYLAFLLLGQQAHANYYHLILAGMLACTATSQTSERQPL